MADGQKPWVMLGRYINVAFSLGVTMAVALFLGFLGGRWLDGRLGTEPVFLIVGLLLGAAMAFKSLLDELEALSKESKMRNGKK